MKIVLANGKNKVDFLIDLLELEKHQLIIINNDKNYCNYLAQKYNRNIIYGNPIKEYVLEEAEITGYDMIIALSNNDADNLVVCQLAKKFFKIKKAVCVVTNPKNVELFKRLGMDTVVSATYMLATFIERASNIDNIVKTLPLENEKIIMNELIINAAYPIVGKKIQELVFPKNTNISCIIRDLNIIIPNGSTKIMIGDKLFVLSTPDNQQELLKTIMGNYYEY